MSLLFTLNLASRFRSRPKFLPVFQDDREISAVQQGLKEAGYIEGRNVAIKYRPAGGRFDRLPGLAAELVADQVAVIIALSPSAALAAKAATATIPIVFGTGADPVELGLVSSLNRPGGNVTGVTYLINTLGAKRLELLRELVPSAKVIGVLINPRNPTSQSQTADVQAAARAHGIELMIENASSDRDIDAAFASLVQARTGALLDVGDAFLNNRIEQIVALAARHAIPTMYLFREFVVAGGLISYGSSLIEAFRQVGLYTGAILKGVMMALSYRSNQPTCLALCGFNSLTLPLIV